MSAQSPGEGAYRQLRYALGFVFGAETAAVPPHFVKVPFPIPFHVNTTTKFAVVQSGTKVIALLGEAVHPDHPDLDLGGIAALLASRFEARQADIDKLIGRFAVVAAKGPAEVTLQTDAIGMRSVFYKVSGGRVVAGSHARLVADAVGGAASAPQPKPFALGYPGLSTPYPGVLRLPPNSDLSLISGRLKRFFPLEAVPAVTIEAAWDLAFTRARQAVGAFVKRSPVLISLTAGLDSRTTLAAVREHWPDITFFTYNRGHPGHLIDSQVAIDIAASAGLRHDYLHFEDQAPNPALLKLLKDNSFGSHMHKLSCAYHAHFGEYKYLHVRTNMLELGRSNLFAKADRLPEFAGGPNTAERMARYYIKAGKVEPNEHVLPAFRQYVESTGYERTLGLANAWDLFFVEHRMGAWHAGVVQESDIAFDTVIAFNSREIVRHFMGVPPEVRSGSDHLLTRLTQSLPEIAHIPINPKQYPLPEASAAVAADAAGATDPGRAAAGR